MPRTGKPESSTVHTGDSSFVSLLSGWVQQGVENFFATQRILVDLAMTQNANAMKMIRSRFADPAFCPAAIASELAGEVMNNFIEGQKLLLGLAQREHEIVTTGVKERVAGNSAAVAMTDLVQRGFDTFIDMQNEFLKMASKQTNTWLNAVKTGKGFDREGLVETAREGMETFVHTQKKFLDVIAEQASKATTTRRREEDEENGSYRTGQRSHRSLHRSPEEADRCRRQTSQCVAMRAAGQNCEHGRAVPVYSDSRSHPGRSQELRLRQKRR